MAGLVAMLLPLTAAGQWRGWVVAKGGSTEGGTGAGPARPPPLTAGLL